jgi:hypothetical protein
MKQHEAAGTPFYPLLTVTRFYRVLSWCHASSTTP